MRVPDFFGVGWRKESAADAALGGLDELDEVLDLWGEGGAIGLERREGLGEVGFLVEEEFFVGGLEGADVVLREAAALEADEIESASGCGVAVDDHEGRDVLDDLGAAADDGVAADAAELVDGGEA